MVELGRNGEIILERRHNMHEQKFRGEKMRKSLVEEENHKQNEMTAYRMGKKYLQMKQMRKN